MHNEPRLPIPAVAAIGFLIILIVGFGFWNWGMYTRVNAGEACVLLRHGRVEGTAGPGKHFDPPWGTVYECRETRPQSAEVGDHEAEADYSRGRLETTTSDGTKVYLTAQVRYITPTESLADLYSEGARSQKDVWSNIVQKEIEKSMVTVTNSTPIADIYPEWSIAGDEMEVGLAERLKRWGITLDDFFLTSVTPPEAYQETIAQQQAEVENQKLANARQETIRAENANAVLVAEGEAEAAKTRANGEADVAIIDAEAEAESNRIVDASLTPNVLYLEYIEALKSTTWAIFSPEDVQPTTAIPPVEQPDEGTPVPES